MTAPAADVATTLAETSPEGLLRAFASLTHRIHQAEAAPITAARTRGDYADDLRAQRDQVRDEILRRIG